jgi:uncharacterized membrane protein
MNNRVKHSFGFLKTTAIGGIFFLLPVVVIGVLLGQLGRIVWVVSQSVGQYLPAHVPLSYTTLMAIAVAIVVLLCFAAGVVARRRIAKRFSESVEKYVLMMFPRYAILKEQLTGNIGGDVLRNQLQAVVVRMPGHTRIGFEVERHGCHADAAGALRESVTVFLPGSPDPWSGQVVILQAHHVERISSPFGETVATFEQLGRGSQRLVERYRAAQPTGATIFPVESSP